MSRSELRAWLRIVGGMRSLLMALDRQLRDDAGFTHDDYLILGSLHRSPDRTMRMSQLADEVGFSPSRLSHTIHRMEGEGWVERRPSNMDARGTEASLTDKGGMVAHEASAGHFALIRKLVFEALGPEQVAATAEAMDEIGRAARDQAAISSRV